ncbi:heavy-metal-associated domain protein [Mycobacterium intracellulare MIN_052511_1280]|nr:heavy-metal-associated domain protein [Mycobacterium intracellulare MIN_052511_1280]
MTVTVAGMTCGHCASSVREEVSHIAGVTAVRVDVTTGAVSIDAERTIDTDAIEDAVEEAGYQLVG